MVQDHFDVKYFATSATHHSQEQYSQLVDISLHAQPQLAERTPLLVVPFPFTTPWFRDVLTEGRVPRPKRVRLFRDNGGDDTQVVENNGSPTAASRELWPSSCMNSDPNEAPFLAKLYYDQYPPAQSTSKLLLNQIMEVVARFYICITTEQT